MKQLNTWTYAIFFAGCYLGAGFVSGNELTQFFGNFGLNGFFGLLIILVGFSAIGTVAAHFAKATGITEVDRLAVGERFRFLRAAIGTMQLLLMFAILTIVHAGIGALLNSLFSIPVWLGSLLFAAIILPIAILGISGVARVLAISVPLLTVTVVTLALILLPRWIAADFPMPHGEADNPLLPTFWIAAATYISFNMGGNITVVLASSPNVRRKHILPGTLLGSLLLAVVASTIMIILSLYPAAMADELPMLSAAGEVHPALGYAYGLLLFLAMSGSGLSKCFGNVCCSLFVAEITVDDHHCIYRFCLKSPDSSQGRGIIINQIIAAQSAGIREGELLTGEMFLNIGDKTVSPFFGRYPGQEGADGTVGGIASHRNKADFKLILQHDVFPFLFQVF